MMGLNPAPRVLGIACLWGSIALVAACSVDPGPPVGALSSEPAAIGAGVWLWQIAPLSCPVEGLLDAADGEETFLVTQEGERLFARFVDGAGFTVVFEGRLDGTSLQGTFDLEAPSRSTRKLSQDAPICDGKSYLTSADDDRVMVIDLRLGALIAIIDLPAGSGAGRPGTTPDQRLLFVPLRARGAVAVIDTAVDRVVLTVAGLGEPTVCAVDARGETLYVAGADGDLASVDLATFAAGSRRALPGRGTRDLVLSPDGTALVAVQGDTSTLDLYDLQADAVRAAGVPTSPAPVSAAFAESETLVVVGGGGVDLFDPDTLTRTATVALAGFDLAVTPDGATAYVTGTSGSEFATVLDLRTLAPTGTIRTGTGDAFGIDLCRGGTVALVGHGGDYPSTVLDLSDDSVFDHLAARGDYVLALEGPRRDVFVAGRRIQAAFAARLRDDGTIEGTVRITQDDSAFASECLGRGQSVRVRRVR